MIFRDLPAEHEADAAAFALRREKRDEQIRGVGDARAVVLDEELDVRGGFFPADAHTAAGFECGFDGVFEEVDEDLFDLRGVAGNREGRAGDDFNRVAFFEGDDAGDERGDFAGCAGGRGQAGEAVSLLQHHLTHSSMGLPQVRIYMLVYT